MPKKREMRKIKIGEKEFEIPKNDRIFLLDEIVVEMGKVWYIEERKYMTGMFYQSVLFAEFPDGKWRKMSSPIEYVAWVNLMKMIDDIKYFEKRNYDASDVENCVMIVKRLFPDFDDDTVLSDLVV